MPIGVHEAAEQIHSLFDARPKVDRRDMLVFVNASLLQCCDKAVDGLHLADSLCAAPPSSALNLLENLGVYSGDRGVVLGAVDELRQTQRALSPPPGSALIRASADLKERTWEDKLQTDVQRQIDLYDKIRRPDPTRPRPRGTVAAPSTQG